MPQSYCMQRLLGAYGNMPGGLGVHHKGGLGRGANASFVPEAREKRLSVRLAQNHWRKRFASWSAVA